MPTIENIAKAISGSNLTEEERLQLSPPLLAHLAAGGHLQLYATDRRRMSKVTLAHLAMCGRIELSRTERNSLSPQVLAILAASQNIQLGDSEIGRLPRKLRLALKSRSEKKKERGAKSSVNGNVLPLAVQEAIINGAQDACDPIHRFGLAEYTSGAEEIK